MRNKKLQEPALLSQEQGIPTDSVSIGGLTNGMLDLLKSFVDHQVPDTKGLTSGKRWTILADMKSIDYTPESLHPAIHGQVMSIRKDGTARDGVALTPGHLFVKVMT